MLLSAYGSGVMLVTFDGLNGSIPLSSFQETEDPVMGSESWGNWSLNTTERSGVLAGTVTIVDRPAVSIVGASPGFIKAAAGGSFRDISSAVKGSMMLVARVRGDVEYRGYRLSFAAKTEHPAYACTGGGHVPFSRGCFKSKNFTISTSSSGQDFLTVKLPFSEFSDRWSPVTGDHTHSCAEDTSTCVTAEVTVMQILALIVILALTI